MNAKKELTLNARASNAKWYLSLMAASLTSLLVLFLELSS